MHRRVLVWPLLVSSLFAWVVIPSASGQPKGAIKFTEVADTTTRIPGGKGRFSDFIVPGNVGPALNNGRVVFMGLGSNGQAGIYTNSAGPLRAVVNTNTPIPDGGGTFKSFSSASLDNGRVMFRGFGSDGQHGIYTAANRKLGTVANINTRALGVVRELSFQTTTPIGAVIPGRAGTFVGNRFVILAENATRNPIAQTRIAMFAANTGPLRIAKETTDPAPRSALPNRCTTLTTCTFSGYVNKALGKATVSVHSEQGAQVLQVDNVGSTLTDGVLQQVPSTMDMTTTLVAPNFSQSQNRAKLVTTQVGMVGKKPNVLFSRLTIANENGHLKVNGEWSLIGTTRYEIQIYNNDRLVTSQKGLPSGALELMGVADISVMRCHIWIIIITSSFYALDAPPSPSTPEIAFCAVDNSGAVREYTRDRAGRIRLLADETTSIPAGKGTFTTFEVFGMLDRGVAVISGRGRGGQAGIYENIGGRLRVVADTKTPIPGGEGTFTIWRISKFVNITAAFGGMSVNRGNIAFTGRGTKDQAGIYARIGGRLTVVADTRTIAPSSNERFINFEYFAGPSLYGKAVAFVGLTNKLSGVYVGAHGKLTKIVATGDELDGKKVFWVLLSPKALEGDRLAFYVAFKDGSRGIYIAKGVPTA